MLIDHSKIQYKRYHYFIIILILLFIEDDVTGPIIFSSFLRHNDIFPQWEDNNYKTQLCRRC